MVSPEKQIWHDFSSGKGGDMFSFVMEAEGLDFKAALQMLARKAGVELEQFNSSGSTARSRVKSRASEALELATKFYQKQLSVNRPALEYLLRDRGLTKQTLLMWRLGYAPNAGRALNDFLTKKGFTTDEIKIAGLAVERSRRPVDMFRGRIMIPLCDAQGAVVGFTARLLADEPDAPKYINTPQTVMYDKSRHIFGLHLAKESIRKQKIVVVVEGNMDVIGSHQAGVTNVVASAGTAMTEMHLRQLKRFTGDVRLCFDADRAGVAASERVIPLAQKTEVSLRIINIKNAKDPDELARKDPAAWQKAIAGAVYATDWLINRYRQEIDLNTAAGKRAFTDAVLATVRRLRDPVEQEHYLKLVAELTDTSFDAVKQKMNTGLAAETTRLKKIVPIKQGSIDRDTVEHQRLQDHFLAMTLMHPGLRTLLADCKTVFFAEGSRRTLLEFLQKNPDFTGDPKLTAQLQPIGDYVKIITLQFEELYADLPLEALMEQAENLKRRIITRYVKIRKHELALAMQQVTGDEEKLNQLIKKANKLNELIKR